MLWVRTLSHPGNGRGIDERAEWKTSGRIEQIRHGSEILCGEILGALEIHQQVNLTVIQNIRVKDALCYHVLNYQLLIVITINYQGY